MCKALHHVREWKASSRDMKALCHTGWDSHHVLRKEAEWENVTGSLFVAFSAILYMEFIRHVLLSGTPHFDAISQTGMNDRLFEKKFNQ